MPRCVRCAGPHVEYAVACRKCLRAQSLYAGITRCIIAHQTLQVYCAGCGDHILTQTLSPVSNVGPLYPEGLPGGLHLNPEAPCQTPLVKLSTSS